MAFIGKQPTLNRTKYTPLSADPSNAAEGDVFYSDGTSRAEGLWVYKNSNWEEVGALSDPSIFGLVSGDNTAVSGWDTSGLTNCTLGTETSSPLNGITSYKFTNVTGGSAEWTGSPAQTVPIRGRGNQVAINFKYKYDGDDSDISISMYDNTGAAVLTSLSLQASSVAKTASIVGYLPSTSSSIELRITCDVVNNGKVLIFDDIEFTDNAFFEKDLIEEKLYVLAESNAGTGITANVTDIPFTEVIDTDSAWSGSAFTAPESGIYHFDIAIKLTASVGLSLYSYVGGSVYRRLSTGSSATAHAASTTMNLTKGDVVSFRTDVGATLAASTTDHKLTINRVKETENVVHHSSGTENIFSARITSADVITSQSSPNAPAIASVLSTSTGLYVITYTTGFFGVIPSVQATAETNGYNCHITAEATTGCTVNIEDPSGTLVDSDFSILIQNQGADYKNPNAYAVVDLTNSIVRLVDGVTEPSTASYAQMYIDSADGDLKIKFSDGTVTVIAIDT